VVAKLLKYFILVPKRFFFLATLTFITKNSTKTQDVFGEGGVQTQETEAVTQNKAQIVHFAQQPNKKTQEQMFASLLLKTKGKVKKHGGWQ
jgi:predicted HTH transcriptional regulator